MEILDFKTGRRFRFNLPKGLVEDGSFSSAHPIEPDSPEEPAPKATPNGIQLWDIRTNEEWRKLGATAENRPTITVDPAEVPEPFRPLIPFAERWAIGCDVTRGDYFDQQPASDIDAFYQAVLPHLDAINVWINSEPQNRSQNQLPRYDRGPLRSLPPTIGRRNRRNAPPTHEEREAKRQHWREVAAKSKRISP